MRPIAIGFVLITLLVSGCGARAGAGAGSSPATSASTSNDLQTFTLGLAGRVSYPTTWLKLNGFPSGRATPAGIISSLPLAPCDSASATCGNFALPPNGVAVEFYFNPPPAGPPYSGPTNDLVGGLPAFREDWGPVNGHDADEGHTWILHLPHGVLVIDAGLKGPDLASGRAALTQILASIVAP
jgi:hypothetical protein